MPEYRKITHMLAGNQDHAKLQKLCEILLNFFKSPEHTKNSNVIIFTEYRESAKEIKNYIEEAFRFKSGLVRAAAFLG